MKSESALTAGAPAQPNTETSTSHTSEEMLLDEPDDELEEFDEIGSDDGKADPEVAQWNEDWDAAGWDDEDVDEFFLQRLQKELEAFKVQYQAKQSK